LEDCGGNKKLAARRGRNREEADGRSCE